MKKLLVFVVVGLMLGVVAESQAFTGTVPGRFASASSCFGCGDMTHYVKADNVWCAWQGDNVIVHVRFRNTSVEHVTISWHPSYTIQRGGAHGDGLTSVQDSGVNAGASRGVFVKQQPKGVPSGSPIGACKPSFFSVKSG